MKKISLFMLMIFGIFMLFATDAAPETAQENAAAPETAQTPAETAAEQAQPAENTAEPVEMLPETSPEPAQTAETPAQEEQKPAETQPAEAAQTSQEPAETAQEPAETPLEMSQKSGKPQKVKYYRPYKGIGIPLLVLGSVSVALLMPAMGTMAFAASDSCKDKDWDFCEQCRNNHHAAWTTGAVLTGVIGAGMIVTGSWLISVQKPRENQYVTLNGIAVLPTKEGMYASVGFDF